MRLGEMCEIRLLSCCYSDGDVGGVVLTLAVLAVLVAGRHGVHAVAGGAVSGRAVGLGRGQAVHALDRVRALAAAGRDGPGGVQAAVERRDGEVVLWLRGHAVGVAQDAHHLQRHGGEKQSVLKKNPSTFLPSFNTVSRVLTSNSFKEELYCL